MSKQSIQKQLDSLARLKQIVRTYGDLLKSSAHNRLTTDTPPWFIPLTALKALGWRDITEAAVKFADKGRDHRYRLNYRRVLSSFRWLSEAGKKQDVMVGELPEGGPDEGYTVVGATLQRQGPGILLKLATEAMEDAFALVEDHFPDGDGPPTLRISDDDQLGVRAWSDWVYELCREQHGLEWADQLGVTAWSDWEPIIVGVFLWRKQQGIRELIAEVERQMSAYTAEINRVTRKLKRERDALGEAGPVEPEPEPEAIKGKDELPAPPQRDADEPDRTPDQPEAGTDTETGDAQSPARQPRDIDVPARVCCASVQADRDCIRIMQRGQRVSGVRRNKLLDEIEPGDQLVAILQRAVENATRFDGQDYDTIILERGMVGDVIQELAKARVPKKKLDASIRQAVKRLKHCVVFKGDAEKGENRGLLGKKGENGWPTRIRFRIDGKDDLLEAEGESRTSAQALEFAATREPGESWGRMPGDRRPTIKSRHQKPNEDDERQD